MKTIQINTPQVSNEYPYGRLKCTATFSVEFNSRKGFRSVFQTINPKTGRLNAPKYGTYNDILFMEVENGFVNFNGFTLHGNEDLNKAFRFVEENFDKFTPEQIKSLSITFFAATKNAIRGNVIWGGSDFENIKEFYNPVIERLVEIRNTGMNLFKGLALDIEAIESKKPIGFNPFKVV